MGTGVASWLVTCVGCASTLTRVGLKGDPCGHYARFARNRLRRL